MTDARIVRTRAALHRSIIDLASEKPAPLITVSELADRAKINRVTFYKHYVSPADTLRDALRTELEATRAQVPSESPDDRLAIFGSTSDQILEHIFRHQSLYKLAVDTPQDGTVPNLLADHFTESLLESLRARKEEDPDFPDCDLYFTARFIAHGYVGAIKAWIQGGTWDKQKFVDNVVKVLPVWVLTEG